MLCIITQELELLSNLISIGQTVWIHEEIMYIATAMCLLAQLWLP